MKSAPKSLVAGVAVLFFVIALAPVFLMLLGSVWSDGIDLGPYRALASARYLKLGVNSLVLALGTTLASLLVGVPQGFLLQRTDIRARGFFRVVYLVPVLIPPYIHANVWMHLLGERGAVNDFFMQLFHIEDPFFTIYGMAGVVFVLTVSYTPIMTAMVMSGLKSIDYGLEETGLLYRTPTRVGRKITLPLLAPHIICGAVFVFVFTIVNFGVPDLLRISVYPTEVFIKFSAFYDEKTATVLSVPLMALTIALILLIRWLMRDRPYIRLSGGFQKAPVLRLNRAVQLPGFLLVFLLFFFSTAVPLSVLIMKGGGWASYHQVLIGSSDEIIYSLVLASLGALVLVALSFPLSYLIERGTRWTRILDVGSLLPFAVPATVLGVGLIKLWNRPVTDYIYGTSLMVLIAYVAHFIPFIVRIILADLKRVDVALEEAAFLTTSGWSRVMRRIVAPLCIPGISISFFLGFILCFGDLSTTILILPPGRETVPIKIYNLMHYGAEHMVSALCLIVVTILLTAGGGFYFIQRRFVKT